VTTDGSIYVLDRVAHVNPAYHPTEPILEDHVVKLAPDGRELQRVSILAERLPAFRTGNVLLSPREIDAVVVLDLEAERVVWALTGSWRSQHQPSLLGDGHLLVFDNDGDAGRSRVIEFDPVTRSVTWVLSGKQHGFDSPTCGSSQRLPNGNTLVTESDGGRALEVTPQGRLVWEYETPHHAGDPPSCRGPGPRQLRSSNQRRNRTFLLWRRPDICTLGRQATSQLVSPICRRDPFRRKPPQSSTAARSSAGSRGPATKFYDRHHRA